MTNVRMFDHPSKDPTVRLSILERLLYWIPLPVTLRLRWFLFDKNDHWVTYSAAISGAALALYCLAVRLLYSTRSGVEGPP